MKRATSFARPAEGGGWVSNATGAAGPQRKWGMGFTVRNRQSFRRNTNPEADAAKIEIRKHVLEAVTAGATHAHVLDTFAGEGHLHQAVWANADSYVGIDLVWYRDDRLMFAGDNRRVLRCIDLSGFTIFDVDAYGEPWTVVTIIAGRRKMAPGETLGLCITDGSGMPARLSKHPTSLLGLAGLNQAAGVPALSGHRDMVKRCLREFGRRVGGTLVRLWEAEAKTGARCLYLGAVFRA